MIRILEKQCKPATKTKEELWMNNFGKLLLTIFAIIYVVSPIDACPGPIDDIIVILITQALKKGGDKLLDND